MFWVNDDVFVFFNDINDMEFDAKLLCNPQGIIAFGFVLVLFSNGMGVAFHTKAGIKINAFYVNALFQ